MRQVTQFSQGYIGDIFEQLEEAGYDEVICKMPENIGNKGPRITVEITPKFASR
jgi:hypothetical protein